MPLNSSERADDGKGNDTAEWENSKLTDTSVREVIGIENAGKTPAEKSRNVSGEKEMSDVVEVAVEKLGEAENFVGVAEVQECEDVVKRFERKKRELEEDNQNSETKNRDLKKLKSSHITNSDDSVTQEVDKTGAGVPRGKRKGVKGTDSSLRMAVVLAGFPDVKMTEEQAEEVDAALTKMFNFHKKWEPIHFTEKQYENGCLMVTCVNTATEKWMYKTVPKIGQRLGAKLLLGMADYMLKGTQFVLWVRTPLMMRSNQEIMDLFQKHNKDIITTEWKIIRRVPQFGKDRISLWVDDKSFEDLKARKFLLFLGFYQVYLMLWSDYVLKGRGLKFASQKWPLRFTNYRPRRSVSPKFTSCYLPQPFCQSRGTELSRSTPPPRVSRLEWEDRPRHRSLKIADTDTPHFREAQFMATDKLSPRKRSSTKPAVVRNRESKVSTTEKPHERGSSSSERSQSRESEDISSDPDLEWLREITKCYSERSQGSDSRQSREVGSKVTDPTHLRKKRHTVSEQVSPRETEYTAFDQPSTRVPVVTVPDRPQSRDFSYLIPDQYKSKIAKSGTSDRTFSSDSGLRFSDEPPSLKSRSKSKDEAQSREVRFVECDTLCARKSKSRESDPPRLDNTAHHVSLSREDRYFVSDDRQHREMGSKSTDPPEVCKPRKATNLPQHGVMDSRTTVPSMLGEMGFEDSE